MVLSLDSNLNVERTKPMHYPDEPLLDVNVLCS